MSSDSSDTSSLFFSEIDSLTVNHNFLSVATPLSAHESFSSASSTCTATAASPILKASLDHDMSSDIIAELFDLSNSTDIACDSDKMHAFVSGMRTQPMVLTSSSTSAVSVSSQSTRDVGLSAFAMLDHPFADISSYTAPLIEDNLNSRIIAATPNAASASHSHPLSVALFPASLDGSATDPPVSSHQSEPSTVVQSLTKPQPPVVCLWMIAPTSADTTSSPITPKDSICGIHFAIADELNTHLSEDHIGRKMLHNLCLRCRWQSCAHSDVPFKKRDHIISHLKSHLQLKPFICHACNKCYKWQHDFHKHQIKSGHCSSSTTVSNANSATMRGESKCVATADVIHGTSTAALFSAASRRKSRLRQNLSFDTVSELTELEPPESTAASSHEPRPGLPATAVSMHTSDYSPCPPPTQVIVTPALCTSLEPTEVPSTQSVASITGVLASTTVPCSVSAASSISSTHKRGRAEFNPPSTSQPSFQPMHPPHHPLLHHPHHHHIVDRHHSKIFRPLPTPSSRTPRSSVKSESMHSFYAHSVYSNCDSSYHPEYAPSITSLDHTMGTVDLHDTDSVYPTPNGAPFLDESTEMQIRDFLLSLPAPGAVAYPYPTQLDYGNIGPSQSYPTTSSLGLPLTHLNESANPSAFAYTNTMGGGSISGLFDDSVVHSTTASSAHPSSKQLLPFNSFHSFGVADLLPLDSISIARTSSHPLTDCLSLNDMSLNFDAIQSATSIAPSVSIPLMSNSSGNSIWDLGLDQLDSSMICCPPGLKGDVCGGISECLNANHTNYVHATPSPVEYIKEDLNSLLVEFFSIE
ncbi:hypothetical protein BDV3_003929 [Batrachochytrium dendrobatidis]